jgi:D-glutamate cyclase
MHLKREDGMDYFHYLGITAAPDDLVHRFGHVLDRLMTLDLNMTGRPGQHFRACRTSETGPISTTAATALLAGIRPGDVTVLVTGCAVRPEIDLSIGEPDGPAGAAAIARALFLTRNVLTTVVVAEPLVAQVEAAFRAAGAAIVDLADLMVARHQRRPLFAVSILAMPIDQDLSVAAADLFRTVSATAVIAVESLGIAIDGRGYFSTGRAFDRGVLRTDAVFREARDRGIHRFTCFDNPNEAGTGRLHTPAAKHPPVDDTFEFLIPGTSANWSAYALAAAISGICGQVSAAFSAELDVNAVEATLRAGAIDPFSGTADPAMGVDTLERGVHDVVTGLMQRVVLGFLAARKASAPSEREPAQDEIGYLPDAGCIS